LHGEERPEMRKAIAFVSFLFVGVLVFAPLFSCSPSREDRGTGVQVVTTLFPLYDFARNVGGEKAHVTLLLPPGVEPHGFEPRPKDMLFVNQADIFVYTGSFMEPWAASIIKGTDAKKLVVVDASEGAVLQSETAGGTHEGHEGHGARAENGKEPVDPHIWLDLGNAQKMVDNICAGFVRRDPGNRQFYEKNAKAYNARLAGLDRKFRDGLSQCKTRVFVHGGHYAFNYLAERYHLTYVSAYGFSPDAEPGPRHLAEMVHTIRQHRTEYVFYEELLQPRVAQTLAHETGVSLLPLNGGHNVTAEEMKKGVTFISLLEQDLENLRAGLQCR
jgi:zinc transport system substrate-binding protein